MKPNHGCAGLRMRNEPAGETTIVRRGEVEVLIFQFDVERRA